MVRDSGKAGSSDAEMAKERLAEATSADTLSDLEEKEKIPTGGGDTSKGEAPVPAPDGGPEERREEHRDTGPK